MFQNFLGALSLTFNDAVITASGGNGWSLDNMFKSIIKFIQVNGGYVLMIVGTAALIWSIVQAFRKYVFQSQEVRTGIVTMIVGAVFGAAFMIGGWNLANNIGQGLNKTATDFGSGNAGSTIVLQVNEHSNNLNP